MQELKDFLESKGHMKNVLAGDGLGEDGVAVEHLDPAVLGDAKVVGLDVAEEQRLLEDRVQLLRQVHHLHGRLCARPELGEVPRALRAARQGERLQLLHEVEAAAGAIDICRIAFRLRESILRVLSCWDYKSNSDNFSSDKMQLKDIAHAPGKMSYGWNT